jgi:hypothetical protein
MAVSLAEMMARLSPEDRADLDRQVADIKAQLRGLQALRLARASTQIEPAQRRQHDSPPGRQRETEPDPT